MTPGKENLLRALITRGGQLEAKYLSGGERSLATKMQREGLTQWKVPGLASRHTCDGQILHITDAGRAALAASDWRGR